MAKARENVQILMEDEDNILPTKKVEGIFAKSARSKPIEKSFSDTRAKLQEELQGKQGELEELNKNLLTNSGDELRKRRGELVREISSEVRRTIRINV